MRIIILLVLFLVGCSDKKNLSSGPFNVYDSLITRDYGKNRGRFIVIKPIVSLQKEVFLENEAVKGVLYLEQEKVFQELADEFNLEYSKSFHYYPGGNFNNRIKIGENVDTLSFEIFSNDPCEIANPNLGSEALGISVTFKNRTHSYDSTFVQFFDVTRKAK